MNNYVRRSWLNNENSPSTGSACAFDGLANWGDEGQRPMKFLEVADCHCKIRLHKTVQDSNQDFIDKMIKLHDLIEDFINHLKNKKEEKGNKNQ